MVQELPDNQPIDYSRFGHDFFKCYFGDSPDVTITELSKILGVGGVRKWGDKFIAWIDMKKLPCVKRKGRARVTPAILASWFERESNRIQSEKMLALKKRSQT
ncbi:MerR family transcriptional regulator [Pelobacter propionicus]|nr:helix-turn-helix domain-containing protein [Pelobacter propionicus]